MTREVKALWAAALKHVWTRATLWKQLFPHYFIPKWCKSWVLLSTVTDALVSPFVFHGFYCVFFPQCLFQYWTFLCFYNPLMHSCLRVGSAVQIILNLTFVLQGKLMPTQKSGFFPSSCVKPYLDPKVKPSYSCVKMATSLSRPLWALLTPLLGFCKLSIIQY